jgi:Fungal N-terminal domain of STAND proteins
MGDPLSVAAGITGLISFASDLAGICFEIYKYGKSVKNAPQAAREVRDQLSSLRRVLLDLEELYNNRTEDLPYIENILRELDDCKACLASFKYTIDPKSHGLKRAVERFLYPTRKDEIREFISQIESRQRRFEAAKANDGLFLTSRVLGVVQRVEQHHLDAELERILNWLSPLEFGQLQMERYQHRRQQSTSTWLLEDPRYVQWRDYTLPTASGLWCTGDPGVGKSITWYGQNP